MYRRAEGLYDLENKVQAGSTIRISLGQEEEPSAGINWQSVEPLKNLGREADKSEIPGLTQGSVPRSFAEHRHNGGFFNASSVPEFNAKGSSLRDTGS